MNREHSGGPPEFLDLPAVLFELDDFAIPLLAIAAIVGSGWLLVKALATVWERSKRSGVAPAPKAGGAEVVR